jgi:hypothetical protein
MHAQAPDVLLEKLQKKLKRKKKSTVEKVLAGHSVHAEAPDVLFE